MKKVFMVCLGLLLAGGLALADLTADRAPAAGARIEMKKEADLTAGTPVAGKAAGGPDAYGFRYIDSDEAGGPVFSWIDITSSGTALNLTDDGEATITSSFPITFYGVSSTNFRVGNNGAVLFDTTAGEVGYGNYTLPNANYGRKSFLVFQDDIDADSGNVYWQELGTAPNRMLVIEWFNRPHFSNTGAATFEMILYEGKEEVLFQYLDTDFGNASYNHGISATVGIQGDPQAANNWFLQYSYLTASLHNNLAIRFYTYTPQAGDLALQSIDEPSGSYMAPDEMFTPMATVSNPGTTPVSNFRVVFDIDDGTTKALVYTDTVDVAGPLQPGNTYQATFDGFTPQGLSNYYVTAYVSASGDPYQANDTLTRYFRTFNELQGNVTDDNNGGAPVDGATITATGPATYTTTTDSTGKYFFFDMTGGTYTVTASKTGYITETVSGVTVADNTQTILDLSMGYPVLTLTPTDSIYVTLPWGGSDSTTWHFQLANDGSREMTYNVSWPEVTKGGKVLGDSLFGFTVNHIASLGIEVAAGYIWVTSAGVTGNGDGNYFLRYDFNGNFVDSLSQGTTSTWGYRDMAFDGTYLYAADENSGGLRQINTTTGAWTGTTITVPGGLTLARGVAYNPDLDRFYAANWNSNIVEFDRSGTQTNSWANTKFIFGLAYDGTNPAGPSLWVWSQDGTPRCQASRFDLTTGTYGSETWQGTAIDPNSGSAGGATVTDQVVPGYRVMLGFIQDTPDRAVAYELRTLNCDWLNISPNTGTVPANNNVVLDVAFKAAGLDSLTDYAANVTFITNAAVKRQDIVPAYMHVIGTGVSGGPTQPLRYAFGLNANRPNPVSGKTTFSFTLPKAQDYSLKVYNIAGQQVASFAGKGQAGPNSISWNTGKNGAGVYFYQLASGGMSATRKLVVVK